MIRLAVQEATVYSMALDAIRRRVDVCRRDKVATSTSRCMAARGIATTGDAGVIKHRVAELHVEVVAEATIFRCCHMRRCRIIDFASGKNPVMAGITALTVDLGWGVIEDGWFKACRLVTDNTILTGRHVGAGLADDRIAIVTLYTIASNARVIVLGTGKGRGVMAVRAISIHAIDYRGRMICRLHGDCGHRAIVTARAVICNSCVIKY